MKLNDEYIQLFSNCIPVKGYRRSMIVDTQRETFYFITNDLHGIIQSDFPVKRSHLIVKYGKENTEVIDSYLEYLFERELVFLTQEPQRFPAMSVDWDVPRVIANGIVDIDASSDYNILKGIREMDALGAEAIQLRFFGPHILSRAESLVAQIEECTKRVRVLELLLSYDCKADYTFLNAHKLISTLVLYNAPKNEVERDDIYGTILIYTEQEIVDASHCGVILPQYFTPRIDFVLESLQFNNCLNKKMSIDVDGHIKNCPSMHENYGHIDEISLQDVLANPGNGFMKKWMIKKDDVSVCKDCEFRLICSDCRAFTEGDEFSKPAKCRFDPYTGKWEEKEIVSKREELVTN
jgi:SPASM domain peptide maturase of grasp-with-spasm system